MCLGAELRLPTFSAGLLVSTRLFELLQPEINATSEIGFWVLSYCVSIWSHKTLGPIAQSVEQRTFNPWVDGSSPSGPTGLQTSNGDFDFSCE